MTFDPAKWPNAVTLAYLAENGIALGVHCHKCARFVTRDPAELGIDMTTPVPALAGRFRCSQCGSAETEARPHYERK
jgi:hypothetical protein